MEAASSDAYWGGSAVHLPWLVHWYVHVQFIHNSCLSFALIVMHPPAYFTDANLHGMNAHHLEVLTNTFKQVAFFFH